MRKPCSNCGCLKTDHGTDIEPITTKLGNIWFRYLKPCLTPGCHCADYQYVKGITYGYGCGDGLVIEQDVGKNLRHLERVGL